MLNTITCRTENNENTQGKHIRQTQTQMLIFALFFY